MKFTVIAVYMNGQTIEKGIEADNAILAVEKMKDLCPRAEEWRLKNG